LLPGGHPGDMFDRDEDSFTLEGHKLLQSVYKLMELAKEANDKGDKFPVFGICEGFLLLQRYYGCQQNVVCNIFSTVNNIDRSTKIELMNSTRM